MKMARNASRSGPSLFRKGKCVEVWQSVDNLGFLTQIGAIPAISFRPRPAA
jgi:hypothetical protein